MRVILAFLTLVTLFAGIPQPVQAQRRPLPATLCGLSNGQVICYDQQTLTPHVLTPGDQRVIDFAISPDATWIVYRFGGTVTMTPIYGTANSLIIDSQAESPADLNTLNTTLAWSPDGVTLAYVTADGLRFAFPPDPLKPDAPIYANQNDRPYTNLRFSRHGRLLAAQSDDGTWRIFEINLDQHTVQSVQTFTQPSEVAWIDDQSLITAYVGGGLARLNRGDNGLFSIGWETLTGHYIKLYATSGGEVVAINPDPGDTIGSAVVIGSDGKITPLGDSKLDSRVRWAADGQMMLYIASGRPILVDRGTGAENMLPMSNISRLIWAPPQPQLAPQTVLDADLFYLAPDVNGIRQVWQIVRSGGEQPRPVTLEPYDVDDFAVSADRSQIAFTSAGRLLVTSLVNPQKQKLLAVIPYKDGKPVGAQSAWRPDGKEIAFVNNHLEVNDSLYEVSTTITGDRQAGPKPLTLGTPIIAGREIPEHERFASPRYSPDGSYLLFGHWAIGAPPDEESWIEIFQPSDLKPLGVFDGIKWSKDNLVIQWRLGQLSVYNPVSQDNHQVTTFAIMDAFMPDQNTIFALHQAGRLSNVVQLYRIELNGGTPEPVGVSGILFDAKLSPTGRFAVGLRHTDGSDQIELLDLQTGKKVWLQVGKNITSLQWVQ